MKTASLLFVCALPLGCSSTPFVSIPNADAGDAQELDAGDAGDDAPSSDAPMDAVDDAPPPDGCAVEDGAQACWRLIDALCARRTSCCVPICPPHPLELGTGCYCLGPSCHVSDAGGGSCTGSCFDSCTDAIDAGGGCHDLAKVDPVHPVDCSKYAGQSVCRSATDACSAALPSMSCSDWTLGDTWEWPASCGPFWMSVVQ